MFIFKKKKKREREKENPSRYVYLIKLEVSCVHWETMFIICLRHKFNIIFVVYDILKTPEL